MQFRRLIFAPSATHLAPSSEKPIHPGLSTLGLADWAGAPQKLQKIVFTSAAGAWEKITLTASAASRISQL